ncbi:G-protein coupled receptor 35 [Patagioenas fasciata monilis]|uniref:G-protein coupled receptor 35 n=1 Tax=Patagioenas fasciata monilis TaxID=372326 RepID=A0A1V4K4C3_PATFA|nr:G-protein coupled receptor 35 [Patagioenas fasciata monilis]
MDTRIHTATCLRTKPTWQPHKKQRRPSMNNCTEDDDTVQNGVVLFQLIVYIPVLSLGIPLNTIAFWIFCCKLKRWTETRVYMINLMVADSFLLFSLPFLLYFTKYDYPIDKLCSTILNIYFINMPMSILIITLIAIDRYIAIKFPLKAKILRSPLKSASIWAAPEGFIAPVCRTAAGLEEHSHSPRTVSEQELCLLMSSK